MTRRDSGPARGFGTRGLVLGSAFSLLAAGAAGLALAAPASAAGGLTVSIAATSTWTGAWPAWSMRSPTSTGP